MSCKSVRLTSSELSNSTSSVSTACDPLGSPPLLPDRKSLSLKPSCYKITPHFLSESGQSWTWEFSVERKFYSCLLHLFYSLTFKVSIFWCLLKKNCLCFCHLSELGPSQDSDTNNIICQATSFWIESVPAGVNVDLPDTLQASPHPMSWYLLAQMNTSCQLELLRPTLMKASCFFIKWQLKK